MNVSELDMNKFESLNSKAIYPRTRKICLPGMVTREFEIVGENVVDAGLRPGLIDKSVDYYVSVHISHQSKNIVKVIINGDNESINEFVDIIQREDLRVKKDTSAQGSKHQFLESSTMIRCSLI